MDTDSKVKVIIDSFSPEVKDHFLKTFLPNLRVDHTYYNKEEELVDASRRITRDRVDLCISRELQSARDKFPGNRNTLQALNEEVGELNKAALDHFYGKVSAEEVFAEAIQVASMAIRFAQEGTAELPYQVSFSCYEKFIDSKRAK